MKSSLLALLSLSVTVSAAEESEEPKKSLSFYVLGDFGTREPTDRAVALFTALDASVAAAEPTERPDFFVSVGDVLATAPAEEFSFVQKAAYFDSDNLRGIPVYSVRGNLDAQNVSWNQMVEASMAQEQFFFPSLYYT